MENPFPYCTLENLDPILSKLDSADDIVKVFAAYECAEVAKWIIAHGHTDNAGNFNIYIKLANPNNLQPEMLILKAKQANPL